MCIVAASAWLLTIMWLMQDFDTISHSVLTMVGVMLGGPDLKLFYKSQNANICIFLLLVYVFIMSLVLLNCLIGIMADACSRVKPRPHQLLMHVGTSLRSLLAISASLGRV